MRVFITGATGFVGQALVRTLRARGWDLSALVRDPAGAPARWLQGQGVALVRGDVTQPDGLAPALRGHDAVLHNAGVYEIGADAALVRRMHAVNVDGTRHVLEAARTAAVPRTLYVSTVWALGASRGAQPVDETQVHDGHYLSDYEHSKHLAHLQALQARQAGLPLTIAMPNGVVGANDHSVFGYLLRLYLMHRLPPLAWGADAVVTLVDALALADGMARQLERFEAGRDCIFAGPPLTLRGLVDLWARHPGGAKRLLFMPRWLARPQMAMLEPLLRGAGLPAFLSREAVDIGVVGLNYSAAKARRELDWPHPDAATLWDRIVSDEQRLLARRSGFLNRLRPLEVMP